MPCRAGGLPAIAEEISIRVGELTAEGLTIAEIVRELGVSKSTVSRARKLSGIRRGYWQSLRAEELRDRVVQLTLEGLSVPAVAQRLKVSEQTVSRARSLRGLARPAASRLTEDEIAAARALLEDGATYTETARTIGRSLNAVMDRVPGYHKCDIYEISQYGALGRKMAKIERPDKESWNDWRSGTNYCQNVG